jgi:predicted O-methyltransferase YrrM
MAYGGSASLMLYALCEKGNDFEHVAIDPYQSKRFKNLGVELLRSQNLHKNFSLLEGPSQIVLANLVESSKSFDLIYIDGSHKFEDVFVDAYYSMRLLNKQGILVFDDCSDKEVLKVIRYMDTLPESFKSIDIREYISFSNLKNAIYPLAKFMGKVQIRAYQKLD